MEAATSSSDPLKNMAAYEIRSILIDRFRNSQYSDYVKKRIQELSRFAEGEAADGNWNSKAGWWKQLATLTARSFLNMSRDVGYYWLRIAIYIMVAICVGTIFFDVGTVHTAILARAACGGFISGFMTFMSIGGFPSFVEEMRVFQREHLNGHYGVTAYILSNFLSSSPFLALISLSSGSIVYYMVKLHPGFSFFVYFVATTFASIAVIESLMMIVASLVPNFLMGIITGAGIIGIMMMTAGFFRLLPDLPRPIWRYPISYISYGSWAMQGLLKNDMMGMEFDSMVPNAPKIRGEAIIRNMYKVELDHSKWMDLAAIFVILVSYRLIFLMVVKFQERASPLFRRIHANITLWIPSNRRSLKKRGSFHGRTQPLHPMAMQEGLSSPLP